jgi:CHAT domain-containing protein
MPSARNLRRSTLGLLACLGLAGLGIHCGPDRSGTPAKESTAVETDKKVQIEDKGPLEPGQVIPGELRGRKGHRYQIALQAGQYVHVVVEQKGVDVSAQLFSPTGEGGLLIDSPGGAQGPESVHDVVEVAGNYPLEIVCEEGDPGIYEARVEVRAATDLDRKRVAAERRFFDAEELRRAESWAKAREAYREVLADFQEIGAEERVADSWFRIGWMSKELGEGTDAVEGFDRARTLYARLGRWADEATMLNFLGDLQYQSGDFQKSLETGRQALEIVRNLGDRELETAFLISVGNSHVALGEVAKGLELFRQALALAEERKDLNNQWLAQFGVGQSLTYQGRLAPARDALERAQALQGKVSDVSRRNRAAVLLLLANIDQREEKLDDAQTRLEQALELQRASQDRNGQAATLNSLGTVLLLSDATRNAQAATEMFQQSLALCRATKNRDGEANALLSLGRAAYEQGRDREAVTFHEQAARIFQEIGDRTGEVSTLFGSARALNRLKDFTGARERLSKVAADVESMRSESASLDLRTGYFATKQHYYDLYIDVLMSLHEQAPGQGWDAKALEMHERRRARGLLDSLASTEIRRGAAPELAAREQDLQSRINALAYAAQQGGQTREAETQQRDLLLALDQVRTEIAEHASRSVTLTPAEPLSLSRIQQEVLDPESLLLVYSLGSERSFVWCIPHEGPMVSRVLIWKGKQIEGTAQLAHRALSRRGRTHADGQWLSTLSRMLLEPIQDQLGTVRLIIVTEGALEMIPFAALPDPRTEGNETKPLIARHEIVHLPSASALALLREKTRNRSLAPRRVAVVASPVFSPDDPRLTGTAHSAAGEATRLPEDVERSVRDLGIDFTPLPATEREAAIVRELIPDRSLRWEALGFQANREMVMSGELRRYRVLHFATHGLLHPSSPELSGLVLSLYDEKGNPRKDGFLRSYEIAAMDLPAELVVLSACQTGAGKEVRGEGPMTLTRSFMEAGARRVVSSLWNVSDSGTAELMRRFYQALVLYGLRPAQALRCSQLSMLDNERLNDPYYWAPFIFQGDWVLDPKAPGGGIETRATGTDPGVKSDSSLPPPGMAREARCPKLG